MIPLTIKVTKFEFKIQKHRLLQSLNEQRKCITDIRSLRWFERIIRNWNVYLQQMTHLSIETAGNYADCP